MKIDRRITGGLAWAGLVVILAVPTVDVLFGGPEVRANITSDMAAMKTDTAIPASAIAPATDPVQTASVGTNATATTQSAGKPAATPTNVATTKPATPVSPATPATQAPSTQVATTGASGASETTQPTTLTAAPATTEVATAQPVDETPPIPMPRNMRPLPDSILPSSQQPVSVASAAPAQPASDQAPLILDENKVRRDQTTAEQSPDFFGPSKQEPVIGEDKLEAWNSGSLSDYLRRNGLLSDASSTPDPQIDDNYDPDGFYLSDGPNQQQRRYYRRQQEDSWYF